jgi:hypothetical protein
MSVLNSLAKNGRNAANCNFESSKLLKKLRKIILVMQSGTNPKRTIYK